MYILFITFSFVQLAFGQQVLQVPAIADVDTLHGAVEFANNSVEVEVIELTTSGGLYLTQEHTVMKIYKPLTIRAAAGLAEKPIIQNTKPEASTRILFEIMDGGSLTLIGLELDGLAGTETNAKYLIRTDDDPQEGATGISVSNPYKLEVFDCYLHDVVKGSDGNFFRAYKYTFADSVIFRNCLFYNCGKEGIRLKEYYDMPGTGFYQAMYVELSNCTFWNTNREAIVVYAGDNEPLTPAPKVFVNHCTFYNCGYDNSRVINAWDCDGTEIKNSIISHSPNNEFGVKLYGETSIIHHCDVFNIGAFKMSRNAQIGDGMLYVDPMYTNVWNADFTLSEASPVLAMADDGTAMGDPRWDPNYTNVTSKDISAMSTHYALDQNYPNPFNHSTTILISMPILEHVDIKIFNIIGKEIDTIFSGKLDPGQNIFQWDANDLPTGIYYCQLKLMNFTKSIKMLLLR